MTDSTKSQAKVAREAGTADTRQCRKCDEVKSLDQFYRRSDGNREKQCSACRRARARKAQGNLNQARSSTRGSGYEAHLSFEIETGWKLFQSYQVMVRPMSQLGWEKESAH